jgi:hypothetical protein
MIVRTVSQSDAQRDRRREDVVPGRPDVKGAGEQRSEQGHFLTTDQPQRDVDITGEIQMRCRVRQHQQIGHHQRSQR